MTTSTGTTPSSTAASSGVGLTTANESNLSNWAGPYVTEMLGRGEALASTPYQAYTGPLTAGSSALQQQAFQGLAGLAVPTNEQMTFTPQAFTGDTAQQYMNPYLQASLDPQLAEARRQAEIQRQSTMGQYTKAGAYGGGRQAIANAESDRALLANLANITGKGYNEAYTQGLNQFNAEQNRGMQATQNAQQYGLNALAAQRAAGETERAIEAEGIAADKAQFEAERDDPFKKTQFMQSLLQNLPLATQSYSYSQPSAIAQASSNALGIMGLLNSIFGNNTGTTSSGTT